MVYDICSDQHLVKVHIDCVSETRHVDDSAVCLGLHVVPHTSISCIHLSCTEESRSGSEEWHSPAVSTNTIHSNAACGLPAIGPSLELLCYFHDTSLTRAYDKRTVPAIHRACISSLLPDPLCESYLPFARTINRWSHARLLYEFLHQLLGYQLCFRGGHCLCDTEHILQEAFQRGFQSRGRGAKLSWTKVGQA
jgi:hypothetical protein